MRALSPELEQIRREVEQLTRTVPSEAGWYQAPPGKWSCALIFEHLLLSYTGTTKGLLFAGHEWRTTSGSKAHPSADTVKKAMLVTKLGIHAIRAYRSNSHNLTAWIYRGLVISDSMRRFYDGLVALDATLADAERRFGRRTKSCWTIRFWDLLTPRNGASFILGTPRQAPFESRQQGQSGSRTRIRRT